MGTFLLAEVKRTFSMSCNDYLCLHWQNLSMQVALVTEKCAVLCLWAKKHKKTLNSVLQTFFSGTLLQSSCQYMHTLIKSEKEVFAKICTESPYCTAHLSQAYSTLICFFLWPVQVNISKLKSHMKYRKQYIKDLHFALFACASSDMEAPYLKW